MKNKITVVIKQIVRMSSKIYKKYKLMGDKMGNKRKIKRELEKKEARCVSIIMEQRKK